MPLQCFEKVAVGQSCFSITTERQVTYFELYKGISVAVKVAKCFDLISGRVLRIQRLQSPWNSSRNETKVCNGYTV